MIKTPSKGRAADPTQVVVVAEACFFYFYIGTDKEAEAEAEGPSEKEPKLFQMSPGPGEDCNHIVSQQVYREVLTRPTHELSSAP